LFTIRITFHSKRLGVRTADKNVPSSQLLLIIVNLGPDWQRTLCSLREQGINYNYT